MRSSKTPIRTVACVIGLGLVFVQAAFAADKQPIRFNAADQAAAKAVTLKAADLGPAWKGGARKPDLTSDDDCSFKRSDLVLTGAAKSEFKLEAAGASSPLSRMSFRRRPWSQRNGAAATETAATWRAPERS